MGISLSAPTVYEEYPMIRYKANSAGAVIMQISGMAAVLIVPIIICLAMQNFWLLENTYVQTPAVSFSNKCALRVTFRGGEQRFWACSDAVNTLLIGDSVSLSPYFSLLSDDRNSDGLMDKYIFTIGVPLPSDDPSSGVAAIEFLPEFSYKVENFLFNIIMTVAPLVTVVNPDSGDGSRAAIVSGDMQFRATDLVISSSYVSYAHTYRPSYFDTVTEVSDLLDIGLIARRYADRNLSVIFVPKVVTFGASSIINAEEARLIPTSTTSFSVSDDLDDASMFQLRISMRVLAAMVNYQPSVAEALKWAWVQYMCIGIIIYYLVYYFQGFFVKNAVINTIALWEGYKR
jgi:transmembrane protein 231